MTQEAILAVSSEICFPNREMSDRYIDGNCKMVGLFSPNMFWGRGPSYIVTPKTASRLALFPRMTRSQWILRKTIWPGTWIFHPFQDMRDVKCFDRGKWFLMNTLNKAGMVTPNAARHHGFGESRTMCFCNIPTLSNAWNNGKAKQRCTHTHTHNNTCKWWLMVASCIALRCYKPWLFWCNVA